MPIGKQKAIAELTEGNRRWAESQRASDPDFFSRLSKGQQPPFLYIGCADSRVPPDGITGSVPGRLFVTRNIANMVRSDDIALASVVQYAVDVLRVEHVIICGHTACGGVQAALSEQTFDGPLGAWLAPLRSLVDQSRADLAGLDEAGRWQRMVELNVQAQVRSLADFPIVRAAWDAGRDLSIQGWVFDVEAGRLNHLNAIDAAAAE
jgi:carbonic anhydrase